MHKIFVTKGKKNVKCVHRTKCVKVRALFGIKSAFRTCGPEQLWYLLQEQ